jgi:hypothetical protein
MDIQPHQQAPAEVLQISPESLEIANCYLQLQCSKQVADALDVPVQLVTQTLARSEVKSYINQVFYETGFNNRFKLRELMDTLIQTKLQELAEAQTGSNKDILDIIAQSHKMTMEVLDREIQLEKLKQQRDTNIKSQVNVQINEGMADSSKYGQLIAKLLQPGGTQ